MSIGKNNVWYDRHFWGQAMERAKVVDNSRIVGLFVSLFTGHER